MKENTEKRTLGIILDELNKKVDAYNKLDILDPQRVELTDEAKKLVDEYNEVSLLTVWSTCMKADLPVKALVETFSYNTVSIKDAPHKEVVNGVKRTLYTRSVTEKPRMLDITKFIEWAAESNKLIANSKDWKSKMLAAKVAIKTEWKKCLAAKGDSHSYSIRKMKAALQEMFDALLFIPTEKGRNALVANSTIANFAFAFANKLDPKVDADAPDGSILPESNWKVIQMKVMRTAVTGKELNINYNDEEDEVEVEETTTTEEKTENK